MVTSYLDFAEKHGPAPYSADHARLGNPPNRFIEMFEYGLLKDTGKVSMEIARLHAETEFEKYRVIQDRAFLSDYDKFLLELEAQANATKDVHQEG